MCLASKKNRKTTSVIFQNLIKKFSRNESGVAAIEFAMVFPVMLVTFYGIVDLTQGLATKRQLTYATSSVGDLITQAPASISKADMNGIFLAVDTILDPKNTSNLSINIVNYKNNDGTPLATWNYSKGSECPKPTNVTSIQNLFDIQKQNGINKDIIAARLCIDMNMVLGKIVSKTPFTANQQILISPRQYSSIDCADCSKPTPGDGNGSCGNNGNGNNNGNGTGNCKGNNSRNSD